MSRFSETPLEDSSVKAESASDEASKLLIKLLPSMSASSPLDKMLDLTRDIERYSHAEIFSLCFTAGDTTLQDLVALVGKPVFTPLPWHSCRQVLCGSLQ